MSETIDHKANIELFNELQPVGEQLLKRHLDTAREWFPHKLVPWEGARNFTSDETWDQEEYPLSEEVRAALWVNLLTEDNLPYYFHHIAKTMGDDEVWGEWGRRWTAEEGRHSIVMRDYIVVTRALDLVALERARMQQVSHGFKFPYESSIDTFVYVALQELATRISHAGTGALLADESGKAIMDRVARDENLHYLFYRDIVTAALEVNPSLVMPAIERQVRGFKMPGTGIDNFDKFALAIARAGIYSRSIHYKKIIKPVILNTWKIDKTEGLNPVAEESRVRTMTFIERLEKKAARQQARLEEQQALAADVESEVA